MLSRALPAIINVSRLGSTPNILQTRWLSSDSSVVVTKDPGHYAVLTLNRPNSLNALSEQVMHDVTTSLQNLDQDDDVRCIIIASASNKAFAAGADIKEMATRDYANMQRSQYFKGWDRLQDITKPIIASVNGYALGGGFELALMCDIIVASDKAQFGLPEITLGVIPGIGGTQRLTRAVGKARAMDMILTGARIPADKALEMGLVSRVVPADKLEAETRSLAEKIASSSSPAVAKAKACVNAAQQLPLQDGVRFERSEFWSCFALQDQKEGMDAFINKRQPTFTHK